MISQRLSSTNRKNDDYIKCRDSDYTQITWRRKTKFQTGFFLSEIIITVTHVRYNILSF